MDPARIPPPPEGFGRPCDPFDIFIPDAALTGPLSGRSAMEDETDLANFALDYAMKKGVSYAEARYEHQEQENFILKNGVLDALYVGQDRGVGVRGLVKFFANSEGSRIRSYSPRLRVFYFLTVAQDGQVEQTYRNYGWSGGWEGIAAWDLRKRVIDEARSMQRSLVEGKKSPEGKMDLVAGPQVAGIASHESCGHPTEADRVLGREASQAGKSFIPPDGIGMRVGSAVVNVVDDPTVEHAIAYYRTDDEGVKARRRYLYKEGRVTEFLQNRETAAAMHTRSNGAARAVNYNVEAIVRMANTFVEPKDHTVEELLEDVKFGVYMKSFMEWNID